MTPAGLLDVRVTLAGRQLKAVFLGGDFFAGESAVADIEGSLRWHSSKADSVRKTLEVIYLKWEEELSFLPLQTVCKAIVKATASAKAISKSNTAGYGCFVNPQTGNEKPSHP